MATSATADDTTTSGTTAATAPVTDDCVQSLQVIDTKLTADCVETCPDEAFNDVVVAATYQLDEATRKKSGQLLVFQVTESTDSADTAGADSAGGGAGGGAGTSACSQEATLAQRCVVDTSAIFDAKWSYRGIGDGGHMLGVATMDSELLLFQAPKHHKGGAAAATADDDDGSSTAGVVDNKFLSLVGRLDVGKGTSVLSLDWSNRVSDSTTNVAVSLGNGRAAIVDCSGSTPTVVEDWGAHNMFGSPIEVWITAFDYWSPTVLYTGADDGLFKGWDTRTGMGSPVFTNESHGAGVCSMHCNPHVDTTLITGSYDGHIRAWDKRKMSAPLTSIDTGGGVWRLKWHPSALHKSLVLAACMRGGVHIHSLDSASKGTAKSDTGAAVHFTRLLTNNKHGAESLAYGVDWIQTAGNLASAQPLVASCSFYNHELRLWRPSKALF